MRRTLLYTITLMLLFSCKSIDKLVEQGRYDEAIFLAIDKLAGQKNKKREHVVAFERAFAKVMQRDLDRIAFLESQGRPENWVQIHRDYERIRTRQNRIKPFIPLIAKDGYEAKFKFINVNIRMKEATDRAADFYYQRSLRFLEEARQGEKLSAREAYKSLRDIEKYYFNYKDSDLLINEALHLGKTRILVNLVNNAPVIFPENFEAIVRSVHVYELNTLWKEHYIYEETGVQYDLFADLQILDLQISPSLESRDHWYEEVEVEDGWKYVRDRHGKIKLDTLGNKLKYKKYKKVGAEITKVTREKEATIIGNLIFREASSGIRQDTKPINVVAHFKDESYSYSGDKRALPDKVKRKLDHPRPFPSDYDLTMEVTGNLKGLLKRELANSTW